MRDAQCVALDKLATVSFWLKCSGCGNSNKTTTTSITHNAAQLQRDIMKQQVK